MILIKLIFAFFLMIVVMAFVFGFVAFLYGKYKLDELRQKMQEAQNRFSGNRSTAQPVDDDVIEIETIECSKCGAFVMKEETCSACGHKL